MSRPRHALCLVPLVLALAVLAGCSSSKRVPVSGTVTFDGKPVDGGVIAFLPEGDVAPGGKGTVSGEIVEGKYSLPSGRGPDAGKYKVQITWNKKTGKQIDTPGDPGTKMDDTVQVIPPKYNKQTILTAEIKSGSNDNVNFELTSK